MGSFKFQKILNEEGLVYSLELSGALVLDHSQKLKEEFIAVTENLNIQLEITISDLDEIDISGIQLLAAFIKILDRLKVKYQFNWNIGEEQLQLMESIGLSSEFF
ncbi:MAG: STAS domain-containing protein [Prolixibacteraceae bacterium]